ncbi:twin-arginine translocation signal domain-containing protein [Streptomyces sp. ME19-01-6]
MSRRGFLQITGATGLAAAAIANAFPARPRAPA